MKLMFSIFLSWCTLMDMKNTSCSLGIWMMYFNVISHTNISYEATWIFNGSNESQRNQCFGLFSKTKSSIYLSLICILWSNEPKKIYTVPLTEEKKASFTHNSFAISVYIFFHIEFLINHPIFNINIARETSPLSLPLKLVACTIQEMVSDLVDQSFCLIVILVTKSLAILY